MGLGKVSIAIEAAMAGFESDMGRAQRLLEKETKRMDRDLQSLRNTAKVGVSAIAGFAGGLLTVTSALQGFNVAVDGADRLDELSARFGISTERLSAWGYAAKMTGGDLESIAGIIPKFSKVVADAADEGSEAGKAFAAIGIKVKDQAGNLRSFQDLLPEVADRFKLLKDGTTETALAMQFFGRSGAEFLEFLNLGSAGMKTMEDRARALGIVINAETAGAAADFKDRVDDLKAATQGWFTQIAAELLPTLTDLTKQMTEFVKSGGDAALIASSVASSIKDIAGAIRFLGSFGNVFDRVRGGLAGLELQGNAALQSLNPANWNPADLARLKEQYDKGAAYVENGWKAMQQAQEQGAEMFSRAGPRGRRSHATSAEIEDAKAFAAEAQQRAKYQEALNKLLAGRDPKKPGAGRSTATSEIEQVRRAYESLMASMNERIALIGQEGEAAKVRYATEYGALAKLEPALKSLAIAEAERLDAAIKANDEVLKRLEAEKDLYDLSLRREADKASALLDVTSGLAEEIKLLRMSADEQERHIAVTRAGVDAMSEEGKAISDLVARAQDARKARYWMDELGDSMFDLFAGVLDYTKGAKEAFGDFVDDIRQLAIRLLSDAALRKLGDYLKTLGQSSGGAAQGGGGGWFSSLLGMIGSAFGGGRASGGPTQRGRFYEVNENGPELYSVGGRTLLMAGGQDGHVTPLGSAGGRSDGNTTVIAVYSEEEARRVAKSVMRSDEGARITMVHFQQNRKQAGF